jgi:hypothetical protein
MLIKRIFTENGIINCLKKITNRQTDLFREAIESTTQIININPQIPKGYYKQCKFFKLIA